MATALAPIVKTTFARRITRGGMTRPECWGAQTTDGVWAFEREDSPGTPWVVVHLATGRIVAQMGTLRRCRLIVASGAAQRALEQQCE